MDSNATSPDSPTSGGGMVPTKVDPVDFLAGLAVPQVRLADARVLLEMMEEATAAPARMWGPSIIGFGQYHYKYASGREGDGPAVAFSPRKSSLVLYGLSSAPQAAPLLAKLGSFKAGASCLYINKLADVDADVLRQLIIMTYRHLTVRPG